MSRYLDSSMGGRRRGRGIFDSIKSAFSSVAPILKSTGVLSKGVGLVNPTAGKLVGLTGYGRRKRVVRARGNSIRRPPPPFGGVRRVRRARGSVLLGGRRIGRGLFDKLKSVVSAVAPVLKQTGVLGKLATLANPTAGSIVKATGYGRKRARRARGSVLLGGKRVGRGSVLLGGRKRVGRGSVLLGGRKRVTTGVSQYLG